MLGRAARSFALALLLFIFRLTIYMKLVFIILCSLAFAAAAFGQTAEQVLATANGQNFTIKDLSPAAQKDWLGLPSATADARTDLLSQMITNLLLEAEAKARNSTVEKITEAVKAQIPAPKEADVQAIYDNNRAALGTLTLEQARPQIIAFLRGDPEQKAFQNLLDNLRKKYAVAFARDVNTPDLKPSETLVTVGGRTISVQDFETKNKIALYEVRADAYDRLKANLDEAIYRNLLAADAKAQGIETGDLIAREITDKLRDYTPEEGFALQNALRQKLYAKYPVKFTLAEPAPVAQTIATEGSPSRGSLNAPVTVVMFSDFQCSHCAAAHPVLQKVIGEYKDKIRFVVRDFPLVSIHGNAFNAALAANAAYRQGKFFEYIEILYKNQDNLDKDSLKKYAAGLNLNLKQFELDLNDEKNAAAVRRDIADGEGYGIHSTPTIFISGIKARDISEEGLRRMIEKALAK